MWIDPEIVKEIRLSKDIDEYIRLFNKHVEDKFTNKYNDLLQREIYRGLQISAVNKSIPPWKKHLLGPFMQTHYQNISY